MLNPNKQMKICFDKVYPFFRLFSAYRVVFLRFENEAFQSVNKSTNVWTTRETTVRRNTCNCDDLQSDKEEETDEESHEETDETEGESESV